MLEKEKYFVMDDTQIIDEYRKIHKRCRTCVYTAKKENSWYCTVKKRKYFGNLYDTIVKGMFCKIYAPILY